MIAQTVAQADHLPVIPTPRLRLAMAWLTVAAGEGQAMEMFWQDCRGVMPTGPEDFQQSYLRRTKLNIQLQHLCERIGTDYEKITQHARGVNAEWP